MEARSSEILLEATHVQHTYTTDSGEDLTVLRDVNLSVHAGEVVSIMGSSGSGKSTLLHILGALDRPTSGTVRFKDTSIHTLSAAHQAHFRARELGFVFQFHHLLPEFTALENVAMPALLLGKPLSAVTDRASKLLAQFGLSERSDHRPAALSGGERQRVAMARALMNAPALILADEPTGNLDRPQAEALHDEITRLKTASGQSFVIVTHNESLAARSDRVFMLQDGLLVPG